MDKIIDCSVCGNSFRLKANSHFSFFVQGKEGIINDVCEACKKEFISILRGSISRSPQFDETGGASISNVLTAYKVVKLEYDGTYSSYCAIGELSARYVVGQAVYAHPNAIKFGLGLTAFKKLETATEFLTNRQGNRCGDKYHIYECRVEPMKKPSRKAASAILAEDARNLIESGEFHKFLLDTSWEYGTVLCDSIKLLRQVPQRRL